MRAQALISEEMKCGDDGLKDTPVPIPNTEVKLQHAESSWGIAPCEDRTLPRQLTVLSCTVFFITVYETFVPIRHLCFGKDRNPNPSRPSHDGKMSTNFFLRGYIVSSQ